MRTTLTISSVDAEGKLLTVGIVEWEAFRSHLKASTLILQKELMFFIVNGLNETKDNHRVHTCSTQPDFLRKLHDYLKLQHPHLKYTLTEG